MILYYQVIIRIFYFNNPVSFNQTIKNKFDFIKNQFIEKDIVSILFKNIAFGKFILNYFISF
jgi:hypothetical protein